MIVSDNAKTFKATEKAFTKLFGSLKVQAYLENNKLEWRFKLEFFERMFGTLKRRLRKVLGNSKLTYDELLTTLVEIEGTLEILTPSHLIFGRDFRVFRMS
jgi:hypothetical protein